MRGQPGQVRILFEVVQIPIFAGGERHLAGIQKGMAGVVQAAKALCAANGSSSAAIEGLASFAISHESPANSPETAS